MVEGDNSTASAPPTTTILGRNKSSLLCLITLLSTAIERVFRRRRHCVAHSHLERAHAMYLRCRSTSVRLILPRSSHLLYARLHARREGATPMNSPECSQHVRKLRCFLHECTNPLDPTFMLDVSPVSTWRNNLSFHHSLDNCFVPGERDWAAARATHFKFRHIELRLHPFVLTSRQAWPRQSLPRWLCPPPTSAPT